MKLGIGKRSRVAVFSSKFSLLLRDSLILFCSSLKEHVLLWSKAYSLSTVSEKEPYFLGWLESWYSTDHAN